GIGRTVFEGTRVEEFKVHVLGVLQNVVGPHRSLILARLEGGPLATTGVIAGMSGSPVYIDGKLIGAVSYALGAFPKEPIAGITPIAEMTDATSFNDWRPTAARVHVECRLPRDGLVYAFGHPMYNLGPTEFPMTRPYVYTVLPSLFSSLKLSATGDIIGTVLQDRATAIAGRLGPGPRLIPITLTLESDRGPKRT